MKITTWHPFRWTVDLLPRYYAKDELVYMFSTMIEILKAWTETVTKFTNEQGCEGPSILLIYFSCKGAVRKEIGTATNHYSKAFHWLSLHSLHTEPGPLHWITTSLITSLPYLFSPYKIKGIFRRRKTVNKLTSQR